MTDFPNYARPQHTRGAVDRAGAVLVRGHDAGDEELKAARQVMGDWRSVHSCPLRSIHDLVKHRTISVCGSEFIPRFDHAPSDDLPAGLREFKMARWLTAQRLKRMWSIENKLVRHPKMHLSRMQDLGGCRVILRSLDEVEHLYESLRLSPLFSHELVGVKDYIEQPKSCGYRGKHLVFRFRTDDKYDRLWNGCRIEVQIRTRFQHAWATAVEHIDAIEGIGLKVGRGEGRDWHRFFRITGEAIDILEENDPNSENYPDRLVSPEMFDEIEELSGKLEVKDTLSGLAVEAMAERSPDDHICLLTLDTERNEVRAVWYPEEKEEKAQAAYLLCELDADNEEGVQVCLVKAQSLEELRTTYGSFFRGLNAFDRALDLALGDGSSWFERGLLDGDHEDPKMRPRSWRRFDLRLRDGD